MSMPQGSVLGRSVTGFADFHFDTTVLHANRTLVSLGVYEATVRSTLWRGGETGETGDSGEQA